MRAYLAIIAMRFKMLLQYRAAALAGFGTQLFWGFIKVMVFVAFFEASDRVQPMSFAQVLVYIWLGQALLALLPWNVDQEIAAEVRTGAVVYQLLRPLDLYWFMFARTLVFRAAPTLLRAIPMVLFAMLLLPLLGVPEWRLQTPPSVAAGLWFAASVAATLLLATAVTMVMHIALFWTVSGDGFNRLMPGIVPVFSGLIIPLPLFPDWLQPVLYWQPFRGLADVPFRIYSGHIAASQALQEILLQCMWAALIVLFGLWLLDVARRRVVVHGG